MAFVKYLKRDGATGVSAYESCTDNIKVVFGEWVYVYTFNKPGRKHVEIMKQHAIAGKGLSTYISQNVKGQYEKKYLLRKKL